MIRCFLTTTDNPYNPYSQFEDWYRFDIDKGYNSCGLLMRVAYTSDQLTDAENAYEIEQANCITLEDTNGNRKLYKQRHDKKIDAVAALMDAYVAWKLNRDAFE